MIKRLLTMWETQVQSLGREDLLEKEMATHSGILARKSHGWRSLIVYSLWGCKESDTTELLHFTSLVCVCVLSCFSRVGLFATPWTVDYQAHQASPPYDFSGKNTGVGFHFLLYGIFLIQVLNPWLLCL